MSVDSDEKFHQLEKDLLGINGRQSTHEQVCAERYKTMFNKLESIENRLLQITPVKIVMIISIILGLLATIIKLFGIR